MSDISINQNEQTREAERAVLGGLMLETHRFDTVIQVIKENDFDGKGGFISKYGNEKYLALKASSGDNYNVNNSVNLNYIPS